MNCGSAKASLSFLYYPLTLFIFLGRIKSPVTVSSASVRRSSAPSPKYDWVVLDSLSLGQMGKEKTRTKEALLFTKYRYNNEHCPFTIQLHAHLC